ncbi:P63C domain-containing protein [Mycolicibacterium sp. Dal123E01]|uniref:P63C domain-containing protein n=1 Tax=Mycolicibacterium sp. Dal123E01 TaxID=3457578 RepID=UPI00403E8845
MTEPSGRAAGGVARAKGLTAAQRKSIAQKAAAARWDSADLPQAVTSENRNSVRLADTDIDAYVLDDGTRVLSQSGFLQALGRNKRAAMRSSEIPPMLQGKAFEQFLTAELLELGQPVHFRTRGGLKANGYRAEFLPQVCEVYLKARDAGTLAPNQKKIAAQAELLMRAFATVGIIALVDEATGYQDVRARDALAKILEEYIDRELQPWVRTFPDDFYGELCRLRGLELKSAMVRRPQYFGHLTNDVVYKRIAPGVLDELKRVTPRDEKGRTKNRYFQHLTANLGYPKLREHLGSIVTLMKLSKDWPDFQTKLDQIHPRFGDTMMLQFPEDDGTGL